MKISLILCTINRVEEVRCFLNSLLKQKYKNFEVIVVDQNPDKRLDNILLKYKDTISITHIQSEKGLSKSRNVGMKYISGDIVAFPDDDCTYPSELLENIQKFFQENKYNILTGKTIDKETNKIIAGNQVYVHCKLACDKIYGSSTTLFIKLDNIDRKQFKFDEDFGVGAKYQSEEENDLIFRLLYQGYKGFYDPDINYVYHPPTDLDFTNIKRVKERTIGLGAFIAKHFFTRYGIKYFIKYNLFRPLLGLILFFFKGDIIRSKFYFYRFIGIWQGFLSYHIEKYKK